MTSIVLNPTPRPAHQVASQLRSQIQDGDLEPGQRLPSVRQLSKDMGVSPNTITAALGILETQRLIKRDQRRGVFVHQPGNHNRKLAVGLISPRAMHFNTSDDWTSHVILSMFRQLQKRKLQPLIIDACNKGMSWENAQEMILENRDQLGGVILCWAVASDEQLKAFVDEHKIPVVQLGMADRNSRHNYISVDYFGAGRIAASHVIDQLPGPFLTLSEHCSHDYPRRQLIAGFQDRLLQERPDTTILYCMDDPAAVSPPINIGRDMMTRYFESDRPIPRVVFGIGDLVAIGAMQICMEHGLRVPQDIQFIGATGLDAAKVCMPTLAHLRQPMDELGQAAVKLIEDMYDQETNWIPGRVLPVQWGEGGTIKR